jgi:hypothetical protein
MGSMPLQVWRALDDFGASTFAFQAVANIADSTGDMELCARYFAGALSLARESGDSGVIGEVLNDMGYSAFLRGTPTTKHGPSSRRRWGSPGRPAT